MRSGRPQLRLLLVAFLLATVAHARLADADATITILNFDDPGEGLNDPTAVAPVGGNSGTTLGEQRLIALQYAADLAGATLDSDIETTVEAAFDPLECDPNSAGRIGTPLAYCAESFRRRIVIDVHRNH